MPLAVELQDMAVVLPQTPAMAHCHQRNSQSLGIIVHDLLCIKRDRRCALVQDRIPRAVVEQPRHSHALLQTTRQHVAPLGLGIPTLVVQCDEIFEVQQFEDSEKILIANTLGTCGAQAVRVGDLLAEGAAGEVRPLRNVEDVAEGGFVDRAAVDRPETPEDAEEGGFAAAIGSDDEKVIALFEGEGESFDQDVAIGGDDRPVCRLVGANAIKGWL